MIELKIYHCMEYLLYKSYLDKKKQPLEVINLNIIVLSILVYYFYNISLFFLGSLPTLWTRNYWKKINVIVYWGNKRVQNNFARKEFKITLPENARLIKIRCFPEHIVSPVVELSGYRTIMYLYRPRRVYAGVPF